MFYEGIYPLILLFRFKLFKIFVLNLILSQGTKRGIKRNVTGSARTITRLPPPEGRQRRDCSTQN